MDDDQLRWFQQVAEGVTVTEVSDLAGVSQSGVSRALNRLDAELGVPLLRRSGRVLRPTRAGAAFKHYVDRALATLDDGVAVLGQLASPESGTVSIAFQPSLGGWLVPRLVADFRLTHPHVHFDLRLVRDADSGHAVTTGDADIEITALRPPTEGLASRQLMVEQLHLAVASSHRLAGRERVGLAEVAADPFVVLRREYALRGSCEALCARAGFEPEVAFEGDDVSTLIGFVASDLGVSIVPRPRTTGSGTAGEVSYLTIDDPDAHRIIRIYWSSERRLPPAVQGFRAHVIESAHQVGR